MQHIDVAQFLIGVCEGEDIVYPFNQIFRHGQFVARRPFLVIVSSLLLALLTLIGFVSFHWESHFIKLWLPEGSDFIANYEHLWHTYPPEVRLHQMIFHVSGGGDILQPQYFKQVKNATGYWVVWEYIFLAISSLGSLG